MQAVRNSLLELQAQRRPAPMGISPATFKTLRLFVAMIVAMSATNPPHQPDVAREVQVIDSAQSEGKSVTEAGARGPDEATDTVVQERSLLGLPHPAYLAGQHPWLMPTASFLIYGSQMLLIQLASWGYTSVSQYRGHEIFLVDKIELGGLSMVVLGGMLRLWCYSEMGEMFTFQVTLRKNHKLITTGPYSYIRHPSYVGMLFLLLGIIIPPLFISRTHVLTALLSFDLPQSIGIALLVVMSFSFGRLMNERAEVEEGLMGRHFGEEYAAYKGRTKKFVPFLW